MGVGFKNAEVISMKCHVCGATMQPLSTDLPFKVGKKHIVIIEDLPTHQCNRCREFLLDDPVMARVETLLEQVSGAAKVEIIHYAA